MELLLPQEVEGVEVLHLEVVEEEEGVVLHLLVIQEDFVGHPVDLVEVIRNVF